MIQKNEELIQSVSVCIATYNGERFIIEQLDSILKQLGKNDEVIIVDDCSDDNTVTSILNIEDPRIKLVTNNKNLGVNLSFELAIKIAKKSIVLLADQDDIWIDGRLSLILDTFCKNNVYLVSGNSIYIDNQGREMQPLIGNLKRADSNKRLKNIFNILYGRASYYGCTMAFTKEIKELILPFPKIVESHDLWIAKCAIMAKKNLHIEDPILYRRIHGENASVIKREIYYKLKSRVIFLCSIIIIATRLIRKKLT